MNDPPLRVCYLLSHFHPNASGAERQALAQGRELVRRGHTVHVLTRGIPGIARDETIEGVQVHRHIDPIPLGPLFGLSFVARTIAALRRLRPHYDLIHTHQALWESISTGLGRDLLRGAPVLVQPASSGYFGEAEEMSRTRGFPILRRLALRNTRFAAISADIERQWRALGVPAHQIARTASGVDATRFHPPSDRRVGRAGGEPHHPAPPAAHPYVGCEPEASPTSPEGPSPRGRAAPSPPAGEARGEGDEPLEAERLRTPPRPTAHGPRPTAPRILFTGRLHPQKNLDLLLDAWPEIARQSSAILVLVGEGPDRPRLEARAAALGLSDRVQFAGHVADPAEVLRTADLFALPSTAEGMSNSLLEAMATGLPCLASDIGGNDDLIEPGRTGLLLPADDPAAWSAAILDLLGDPTRARSLGEAARARVLADFDLPVVVDRYVALYREILAGTWPAA